MSYRADKLGDGRTDWRTDAGNDNTRRPILASGKKRCGDSDLAWHKQEIDMLLREIYYHSSLHSQEYLLNSHQTRNTENRYRLNHCMKHLITQDDLNFVSPNSHFCLFVYGIETPGRCGCNLKCYLENFNATWPPRWLVNIVSDKGLVTSGKNINPQNSQCRSMSQYGVTRRESIYPTK